MIQDLILLPSKSTRQTRVQYIYIYNLPLEQSILENVEKHTIQDNCGLIGSFRSFHGCWW